MPDPYTTCEYKNADNCSIKCDVYPSGKGVPVAVYIHGGALINGSRNGIPGFCRNLYENEGYCLIAIDYRLAPETKLPSIIEDVAGALDWVRGVGAEAFGYNADRMAVTGNSAGGYLTLMTGTFKKKPRVLVPFYGYGDLLGDWLSKPNAHYCRWPLISCEDAQKGIKGFAVSEGGQFRDDFYFRTRQTAAWTSQVSGYDIVAERAKIEKYCPIFNITGDYPPTVLLHGDNDTDVPYEQSLDMYIALTSRGLTAELLTRENGGHGFDFDRGDPVVLEMEKRATEFVKKHI